MLNALLKPFEALRRSRLRADSSGAASSSSCSRWRARAVRLSRFHVTTIDPKKYFEYTPGCLRLFVEPSHVYAIARPLARERAQF